MPIDLFVRSLRLHKVLFLLHKKKSRQPCASNFIHLTTFGEAENTRQKEQTEFSELLPMRSPT